MDAEISSSRRVAAQLSATKAALLRLFGAPYFVPLIILLGLLIRLLVVAIVPVEQMSDSAWYVARAREIAAGLGYQENGVPTAYWPVGWPAVLAGAYSIFGTMSVAIVVLNALSAGVTMYLVYWFGRQVVASEVVGRLALIAYALYPNHIAYTGIAATELFYTALAMGAFALLIARRDSGGWVFLSGLVFGLATLVKPQTLLFPFGAVTALALVFRAYGWKDSLKAGVLVYLGLLVVVSPWTYRNYVVFGEPVLVSTNGGVALLLGANDQMTGTHFDYEDTQVFKQFGIPLSERVSRQLELNHLQKQRAVEWISENPGEFVAWMPKKVFHLWLKDTDGFWPYDNSYPANTMIIRGFQFLNQALYVVVFALALIGAFVALNGIVRNDESRARSGLLYCMPIFVSLLAAVFTGQIRYHFPAMPFLIVAAAWSLRILVQKRRPD